MYKYPKRSESQQLTRPQRDKTLKHQNQTHPSTSQNYEINNIKRSITEPLNGNTKHRVRKHKDSQKWVKTERTIADSAESHSTPRKNYRITTIVLI